MKINHLLLVAIAATSLWGCKKTPSTPVTPPVTEENIVFALDPDIGSGTASALSGTYTFKVNLTSKVPTNGISIDVTTKKDSDGSLLETKNVKSSTASNEISIGTLAAGTLYNVTVVVTSQKTSTNTATKTFKVARK